MAEFDKKFVPKHPADAFQALQGITGNIFTVKDFLSEAIDTTIRAVVGEVRMNPIKHGNLTKAGWNACVDELNAKLDALVQYEK